MMSQYKVGDVAALFAKPKEATTESGKKLQSLFENFHCKKSKSGFQSKKSANLNQSFKNRENGDSEDHSNSKKSKKRKFSAVSESDSTLNVENKANEIADGQEEKISKKKFKGNDSNMQKDFPRKKKKKFGSSESNASNLQPADNSTKNLNPNSGFIKKSKSKQKKNKNDGASFDEAASDLQLANDSTKAFSPNSGFIKKSKHKKNKNGSASFDEANSKNTNVRNGGEVSEGDDQSFKEEIKKFIEDNSQRKKLGKKKKFDINQVSPKKPSDVRKTHKVKSESNVSFDDASLAANKQGSEIDFDFKTSPTKQNQTADFVRKPKIKNKDKNTSPYCDKNVNNALNGNDALFKSEHEENGISHKKSGRKFNGIKSSKQISSQNTSAKTELDFIPISDSAETSDSKPDDAERLNRTVFVGNLPLNVKKKALRTLFSPFGEIENIRTIGIETDKSKIYSKNPPKSLNPDYASNSVPAFVVFKERQSAIDALSLTGTIFKDRHITVDISMARGSKKLYDEKRSVFIGNLPFQIKDESVWNAFSECGRIEGVRLVRDRETGLGKGFGYVVFSTRLSKENALGLKDLEIEGRSIRIKAVESNKEKQKAKETPNKRDTFKSRAIRFKKNNKNPNSRKSVSKLIKKEKTKHSKRKVAAILQKTMK